MAYFDRLQYMYGEEQDKLFAKMYLDSHVTQIIFSFIFWFTSCANAIHNFVIKWNKQQWFIIALLQHDTCIIDVSNPTEPLDNRSLRPS